MAPRCYIIRIPGSLYLSSRVLYANLLDNVAALRVGRRAQDGEHNPRFACDYDSCACVFVCTWMRCARSFVVFGEASFNYVRKWRALGSRRVLVCLFAARL